MGNKREFYELGLDINKYLENGLITDMFYLRDLQSRRLYLDTEVSQDSVGDLVKSIIRYNRDDLEIPIENRTPIVLFIASDGGDEIAGFELIDIMMSSKTPIYTVNAGNAYSMAFLIFLAGDKRFGMQTSSYLLHDGSSFVYASAAKAQDRMMFNQKLDERVRNFVLSKSTLSREEYDDKFRFEWYMFSDEAKDKGFVDYIVGVDCDIDELI